MKRAVAIMAGAAALLGSTNALAQEFSEQGDAAFSADRLFALHKTTVTRHNPDPAPDDEDDYTGIGFGWRGGANPSPFDMARLSFDYFVIDHLSIGGSIAYASYDDDDDSVINDEDWDALLFAPRVGYVWMFADWAGFWLRGGISYYNFSYHRGGDPSLDGFALDIEPTFVLSPAEHFAFVLGPYADFTLAGGYEYETGGRRVERDVSFASYGIQFGLMGWI